MPDWQPMTGVRRGLIDVPVTPFTLDNKPDPATFARVVEFLLRNNASTACAQLPLPESFDLNLDECEARAKRVVEVAERTRAFDRTSEHTR
jgi:dihydrodipicolinate synthase/N-acetylneuraminate lyase